VGYPYDGALPHLDLCCPFGAIDGCGIIVSVDREGNNQFLYILPVCGRKMNSPKGNHITGEANGLSKGSPPSESSPERAA